MVDYDKFDDSDPNVIDWLTTYIETCKKANLHLLGYTTYIYD